MAKKMSAAKKTKMYKRLKLPMLKANLIKLSKIIQNHPDNK